MLLNDFELSARSSTQVERIGAVKAFIYKAMLNWPEREKIYKMLIPRLREGAGSTPERLIELYIRRLQRRGLLYRYLAQVLHTILFTMTHESKSFAQAFAQYIPQSEFSILDAGEKSGDLSLALESLIQRNKRISNINSANRQVIIIIIGSFLLLNGMIMGVAYYALPKVLPISREMSSKSNFSQEFMQSLSSWAMSNSPIYTMIGFLIIIALVLLSFKNLTGKFRTFLERIPPWSTYRTLKGYIWLETYIVLVRSGLPELHVLSQQCETATPWLKERLTALHHLMSQNALLFPDALEVSGFSFPSLDMIDDVANSWGGGAGNYDRLTSSLQTMALEIEDSALQRAKALKHIVMVIFVIFVTALTLATDTLLPVGQF